MSDAIVEIRDYTIEADWIDAYKDWADNIAAPWLKNNLDVIDFWVDTGIETEVGGSSPVVSPNGQPNVCWIIRWSSKEDRDLGFAALKSNEEWKEILINELESYRPIYYWGNEPGENVGHAWNIDGYQENYFHMNLGWGGQSNGYYTLDMMYSANQGAFISIQPSDINEPKLFLDSYEYNEASGDMDMMINPGETFELYSTLLIPSIFNDADNIEIFLSSEESGITILNGNYIHGPLLSGESFSNEDAPFTIQADSGITLGKKTLLLNATASSIDFIFTKLGSV